MSRARDFGDAIRPKSLGSSFRRASWESGACVGPVGVSAVSRRAERCGETGSRRANWSRGRGGGGARDLCCHVGPHEIFDRLAWLQVWVGGLRGEEGVVQ
jgi:hypothetical protein